MASLHLAQEIFKLIYPVGSIYLSDNATNPSSKFGGTWVQLKDHFLYAGSSFSTGNGTGTATNNHTLTIDQIPPHKHRIDANWGRDKGSGGWGALIQNYDGYVFEPKHLYGEMYDTGGGKGHAHNIPYQSIYVWRRTA